MSAVLFQQFHGLGLLRNLITVIGAVWMLSETTCRAADDPKSADLAAAFKRIDQQITELARAQATPYPYRLEVRAVQ